MLNLWILTRTGMVYEGDADSIIIPGRNGYMEILENHVPIISALDTGVITVKKHTRSRYFTISSGLCLLVNNDLAIFSDASETPEQIDLARVMSAKDKAKAELDAARDSKDTFALKMAQDHLKRAENRLKLLDIVKKEQGRS